MTEIQRLQKENDELKAKLDELNVITGWCTEPINSDGLIVAIWDDARGRHIEGGQANEFGSVVAWMKLPPYEG